MIQSSGCINWGRDNFHFLLLPSNSHVAESENYPDPNYHLQAPPTESIDATRT